MWGDIVEKTINVKFARKKIEYVILFCFVECAISRGICYFCVIFILLDEEYNCLILLLINGCGNYGLTCDDSAYDIQNVNKCCYKEVPI